MAKPLEVRIKLEKQSIKPTKGTSILSLVGYSVLYSEESIRFFPTTTVSKLELKEGEVRVDFSERQQVAHLESI